MVDLFVLLFFFIPFISHIHFRTIPIHHTLFLFHSHSTMSHSHSHSHSCSRFTFPSIMPQSCPISLNLPSSVLHLLSYLHRNKHPNISPHELVLHNTFFSFRLLHHKWFARLIPTDKRRTKIFVLLENVSLPLSSIRISVLGRIENTKLFDILFLLFISFCQVLRLYLNLGSGWSRHLVSAI